MRFGLRCGSRSCVAETFLAIPDILDVYTAKYDLSPRSLVDILVIFLYRCRNDSIGGELEGIRELVWLSGLVDLFARRGPLRVHPN